MKAVKFLWATTALLCCMACDSTHNLGLPHKVEFDRAGGSKDCYGTSSFYAMHICDYNGNGENIFNNMRDSMIIVTCDWLTAKTPRYSMGKVELIATPNPTKKKRVLYVYCSAAGNDEATIKVVQY